MIQLLHKLLYNKKQKSKEYIIFFLQDDNQQASQISTAILNYNIMIDAYTEWSGWKTKATKDLCVSAHIYTNKHYPSRNTGQ